MKNSPLQLKFFHGSTSNCYRNLACRAVYDRVLIKEVPRNVRAIPTRFVDTRKIMVSEDGSISTKFKSRLVAIGFLDPRKHDLIDVATAMPPIKA